VIIVTACFVSDIQGGIRLQDTIRVQESIQKKKPENPINEIRLLPLDVVESPVLISRAIPEYGNIPKKEIPKKSEISSESSENSDSFLRKSSVLLGRGQKEINISVGYGKWQDPLRILKIWNMNADIGLRMGITQRTEGFVGIPIVWGQREVYGEKTGEFGLGDIVAGFKHLIVVEHGNFPDIVGSVNLSFPSGRQSDSYNPLNLGSGIWQMSSSLSFVKSSDPAAIFGTVGYNHSFGSEIGRNINYLLGLGFAVNPKLTLSGQFSGAYEFESKREPMSFRAGLSYNSGLNQYIEPSVTFGLNDDATDTIINLSYSRRF